MDNYPEEARIKRQTFWVIIQNALPSQFKMVSWLNRSEGQSQRQSPTQSSAPTFFLVGSSIFRQCPAPPPPQPMPSQLGHLTLHSQTTQSPTHGNMLGLGDFIASVDIAANIDAVQHV
jgi:hypothetical protein